MSDKKNISLQDRGWNEMASILDKELPKKKKRRPLIWIFFSGIAAILLLGIFVLKDGGKESMSDTLSLPSKIIANENTRENDNSEATIKTDLVQAHNNYIAPEIKSEPQQSKLTSLSRTEMSDQNNNRNAAFPIKNEVHNPNPEQNVLNSSAVVENVKLSIKTTINNSSESIQNTTSEPELVSNEYSASENQEVRPEQEYDSQPQEVYHNKPVVEFDQERGILNIPFLMPNLILKNESQVLDQPIIKSMNPKRLDVTLIEPMKNESGSILRPYLYAGSGVITDTEPNYGYLGGLGLSYGNQNWQVYGEANYNKQFFNGENEKIVDIIIDDGMGGIFAGSSDLPYDLEDEAGNVIANFDIVDKDLAIDVLSVDKIFARVGLRKRLWKSLGIDLNTYLGHILNVKNSNLIYSSDNMLLNENFKELNIENSFIASSASFDKSEIGMSLGMYMNLSKNLDFSINYARSFNFNSSFSELDLNRGVATPEAQTGDTNQLIFTAVNNRRQRIEARLRYYF